MTRPVDGVRAKHRRQEGVPHHRLSEEHRPLAHAMKVANSRRRWRRPVPTRHLTQGLSGIEISEARNSSTRSRLDRQKWRSTGWKASGFVFYPGSRQERLLQFLLRPIRPSSPQEAPRHIGMRSLISPVGVVDATQGPSPAPGRRFHSRQTSSLAMKRLTLSSWLCQLQEARTCLWWVLSRGPTLYHVSSKVTSSR